MSDICNAYVKPTTDNTTTAVITYKELYDCKWDPTTLSNNTLYTAAFRFCKYFGLIMACIGLNYLPLFELIKCKIVVCDEVYILVNFKVTVALLRTTTKETPCIDFKT
jgi:hypothetical protein